MITLAWPWVLAALPLPLLAYLMPAASPAGGAALRLPFYADLPGLAAAAAGRRSAWRIGAAVLAWVLLVTAAARPEWVGAPVNLPVAGRDLMLAVDISGSMEQPDYEMDNRMVSRLAVVKAVAARFVERRTQDRLGLILFGSNAYVQTPLTFDGHTVAAMLRDSVVGLAGRETAIGDAIGLAVKRLREQPDDNRVLILLTDGASNAGQLEPQAAAQLAREAGVRIYTIAIGGGEVGLRTALGMRLLRQGGDYDPESLKQIAQVTGGRFFSATGREELEAIYEELDRLEPSRRDERTYRPRESLFVWPAAAALVLSVLLALPLLGGRGLGVGYGR
ncbi:vWA domain-containing protein [Candidatus Thiodictyon syntrophicum]|jgi:Ca-activated chloride channel family protein|uniref:BatB protein n=1 Tax=Candidatus Thiodictyon syntrophicum TaxID=1166950 RepID=A0A2K8U3C1_9GAMM|nr:VWA domain-containing protein [Candidatus Thiodictyon syntrophicum]AUB80086.1 BatB protein [Candidatus Thiodictyon syntrophicum]